MADVVQKIINANAIRNGDLTANVNRLGTRQELNTIMPNGNLDSESTLTNRLSEERHGTLTPYTTYVTVPASGTEVSWAVPEGTEKFVFKARTQSDISFGFNSGDASGVNRVTLFGGTAYENPDNMALLASQSIYFTGTSGQIVEINYWK